MKNATVFSIGTANFSRKQREILSWIKESPIHKISHENGAYFWEGAEQIPTRSFEAFASKMDEAGVKRSEWFLDVDSEKGDEGNSDEPPANVRKVGNSTVVVFEAAEPDEQDNEPKSKLAQLAAAIAPEKKEASQSEAGPRYEGPSIAEMVRAAVNHLGGNGEQFTSRQILDKVTELATEKGVDPADLNPNTVRCYISQMSVNYSGRVNWGINKKDRECNGEFHHDCLFKIDRSNYEKFDAEKHGLWRIEDGEVRKGAAKK